MAKKDPWEGYIEPGKVFGNLYFVGTRGASTHLLDTGDGLLVLDPGYQRSLYLVLHNIWKLGFSVNDIRHILITHGHDDHMAATRALVELTGAKTYMPAPDRHRADLMEHPFVPDHLIRDGEDLVIGNTTFHCVYTPGHTEGTTSFFFDVTDGEKVYRAGMHGGVGLNTLNKQYLESRGLSFDNRRQYFESLEKIKDQKVEIFLGNHVGNNDTVGKLARVAAGEEDAFYAPQEWKPFLERCRKGLEDLIESEKEEA